MVKDIDIAPPIEDSQVIWRYMDFASFCYLLHTKGLFFRRLDRYSDQHEGSLPEEIKHALVEDWMSALPWLYPSREDGIQSFDNTFIAHLKEFNKGTLCCSWVASPVESYAMWKIYLRGSKEGVAIRTTIGRLRQVLTDNATDFTLARVNYDMPFWDESDYKTLASYKTKPYSYESELRALVYDQFEPETVPIDVFPKVPLFEYGAAFAVDTALLIEHVHVSPFADSWFHELVRLTIKSHLPTFDHGAILTSRIKDM